MGWGQLRQTAMQATMNTFGGKVELISPDSEVDPIPVNNCVFDDAHEEVNIDSAGREISTIRPVLFINNKSIPEDFNQDWKIEAVSEDGPLDMKTGVEYRIFDIQEQGAGYTMLVLYEINE